MSPFFLLDTINDLYHYVNPETKKKCPMIAEETYKIVQENQKVKN